MKTKWTPWPRQRHLMIGSLRPSCPTRHRRRDRRRRSPLSLTMTLRWPKRAPSPPFAHQQRLWPLPRTTFPLRRRDQAGYPSPPRNHLSTRFSCRRYPATRLSPRRSLFRSRQARQRSGQQWPRWSRGRPAWRRSCSGCSLPPTPTRGRYTPRIARSRARSTRSSITILLPLASSHTPRQTFTYFWTGRVRRKCSSYPEKFVQLTVP